MVTAASTRRTIADDVYELDEFFEVLVERIDPDAVPLSEATDLWVALHTIEQRAASAKLLIARRVDEAGRWKRDGHRSAADQLALLGGTSPTTAKKQIETSKRVRKLPKTEKALRKGKLSPAKVEAIAAAAEIAPEAEDELLDGAEDAPLGKVLDDCLKARAKDADDAYKRIRKNRFFKEFTDAEGAWNFQGRGTVDDAAKFRATHGPIVDELFNTARKEDRHEPYGAYAFDALIELARRAGQPAPEPSAPEPDAGTDPAPVKKAPAKAAPKQNMAIIRVDHSALRRGTVEGDETCEIAGLGPIPVSVARELLGDAVLKLVITKGVDVANVTHLGRSVTVAQQVALWWRSPCCTNIDCTRTWRLENDHREEWSKTHHTRLDEIDPLCSHDHDRKTYEDWSLVDGTGRRAFVAPHDPRHPKNKPRPTKEQ